MKKIKIFLLAFGLLFIFGVAFAQEEIQETASPEAIEDVLLDESVNPEDLGIREPRVLPDNPFYFFKNWIRTTRLFFTFDPLRKIELRERFANEKLLEARKLVEKTKDPEKIKRAIENYRNEIVKNEGEIERLKARIKERPEIRERLNKFLDKFTKHQLLHQRLLEKLETQVPSKAFEKIKKARERHLEMFGRVMTKLEEKPERIQERLEKNLEELRGSRYKHFKNLEVLKELEEKVPEEAKEAIRGAQENSLRRLKEKFEQMSPEAQERFKDYIEKISGNKEKQMEVLDSLREAIKEKPQLKEKLLKVRGRVLEKAQERIKERIKECPEVQLAPKFCEDGRIIIKKDEKGCIIELRCIIPAEKEVLVKPQKPVACITLWKPVCGKDGRTYSNACFAKVAGVEIAYEGVCKEAKEEKEEYLPSLPIKKLIPKQSPKSLEVEVKE